MEYTLPIKKASLVLDRDGVVNLVIKDRRLFPRGYKAAVKSQDNLIEILAAFREEYAELDRALTLPSPGFYMPILLTDNKFALGRTYDDIEVYLEIGPDNAQSILLHGRPGSGKTIIAQSLLIDHLRLGYKCTVFADHPHEYDYIKSWARDKGFQLEILANFQDVNFREPGKSLIVFDGGTFFASPEHEKLGTQILRMGRSFQARAIITDPRSPNAPKFPRQLRPNVFATVELHRQGQGVLTTATAAPLVFQAGINPLTELAMN